MRFFVRCNGYKPPFIVRVKVFDFIADMLAPSAFIDTRAILTRPLLAAYSSEKPLVIVAQIGYNTLDI